MSEDYRTIITIAGQTKLANAIVSGTPVALDEMAIGDSSGVGYNPSENQVALVNQVYRASLDSVETLAGGVIVCEMTIPIASGGYHIREAGVYDDADVLIAVVRIADRYKPLPASGQADDLTIKLKLDVGNIGAVTWDVDFSKKHKLDAQLVPDYRSAPGGFTNTPPADPAPGLTCVVGTNPDVASAFEGHANELAEWSGSGWTFHTPPPSHLVGLPDRTYWMWDTVADPAAWVEWVATEAVAGPISLTALDQRLAASASGNFGAGYLDVLGGVMTLSPDAGSSIFIGGKFRELLPAGATLAAAPGSNETYYVWAYWTGTEVAIEASSATIAPAPPIADATFGHQVKTGDPSRTYVGIARSGAATAWQDGLLVSSHYRKKLKTVSLERATPVTRSGPLGDIDSAMWIWFVSDEDVVAGFAQAAQRSDSTSNRALFQINVAGASGTYSRNQSTVYTSVVSRFEAIAERGYNAVIGKHGGDGTVTTDNYEITVSKFG